jgi:fused signal recognition particle receptor
VSIESGLAKTRSGFLSRLFGRTQDPDVTDEWIDQLEEALLRADLSVSLVDPVILQVRDIVREGRAKTVPKVLEAVTDALVAVLPPASEPRSAGSPRVILVVGVNGSGKTTTAAKLAKRMKDDGGTPLLAAADTFRAAAIEQLERWAERVGVPVVSGRPGGDPAAVVHDAIAAATSRAHSAVVADTAGRLHTKEHLMEELAKIVRVASRARAGAPDEVLLVLDGTQGQNAIVQAREFTKAANVTGIVVTKLDGTAKGGAVFAIANDLRLPVRWLGVGERPEDLVPMDARAFVKAMFERGREGRPEGRPVRTSDERT